MPIIVFLFSSISSFNVLETLSISTNSLTFEMEHTVWEDRRGLDADVVIKNIEQGNLQEVSKSKLSFSESRYWHRIDVLNHALAPKEITVLFDNPTIDHLTIYKIDEGALSFIDKLGDKNVTEDRSKMALPKIDITVNSGNKVSLLFSTETTGSHFLPVKVFESESFIRYKDAVYMLWGAFIGIVILMAIYNLILYTGSGDKLYVLYIGYIISFLFELGIVHGYNFYLMPAWMAAELSQKVIVVNFLISFFTVKFAVNFMKVTAKSFPKLYKYSRILSVILIIGFCITLFIKESIAAPIFFLVQLIMYTYVIALMWTRLKTGVKWAKYYVASWLPLLFGAAVGSMLFMGGVEYNFWTRHALLLSVMFEMAFISMALAERLRISEAERLYQASHDPLFGFVNSNFILSKAVELEASELSNFSAITVSIQKYDSLSPYIEQESLLGLVNDIANDIEGKLSSELRLIELDPQSRHKSTAIIRDGVFGFLVASNDNALMDQVLNELAKEQPKTYNIKNVTFRINMTIGVASLHSCKKGAKEIINRSLQAAEIANQNKTNLWSISDRVKNNSFDKMSIASELKLALDKNKLILNYQPQISLKTGQAVSFEVLLKWKNSNYGYVSTEEIVSIAEETGLITNISKWVFESACRELRYLKDKFNFDGSFSINVSCHDIVDTSFMSSTLDSMTRHNIKANWITLEILESQNFDDNKYFHSQLNNLNEVGFRLAIDNFGKGRSSLSYLGGEPFAQLNVDNSIVSKSYLDETKLKLLKTCINLAHTLDLQVLCEGVEDKETLKILQTLNCDIAQGYYLFKPVTFEELTGVISSSELTISSTKEEL